MSMDILCLTRSTSENLHGRALVHVVYACELMTMPERSAMNLKNRVMLLRGVYTVTTFVQPSLGMPTLHSGSVDAHLSTKICIFDFRVLYRKLSSITITPLYTPSVGG